MRVYLAADFGRQAEMRGYRAELQARGVTVTSSWLDEDTALELATDTWAEHARTDLAEIKRCGALIAFTTGNTARGGRHFEAGYAFALGLPVIVVGPGEHVFHTLATTQHEDWADFLAHNSLVAAR